MELISKGELLEWFRPYGRMDEPITFENLAGFVRDIATKYAPTSEWISVENRLPEEHQKVLIICKNGAMFVADGYIGYDEIVWKTYGALGSGRRIATCRVTHWQPLPEPPKEAHT